MSWYRSYLQDAGLYCTSPPNSPTAVVWADAPSGVTTAAAAATHGTEQARPPGAVQAPDHQQKQQQHDMPSQQPMKLYKGDMRDRPQPAPQQQHAVLAPARQQASVSGADSPTAHDPMLFKLAAALEAGWEGGSVLVGCTTAGPAGPVDGNSSRSGGTSSGSTGPHSSSSDTRSQLEPPTGLPVSTRTAPDAADSPPGSRLWNSSAATAATAKGAAAVAATATKAAAAAGRDATTKARSSAAAAAALAPCEASEEPRGRATKAAGKETAARGKRALPQQGTGETGQQQRPSPAEAATLPAAAVPAAATAAAAGGDPLWDFDLLWEGAGPQRQPLTPAATNSSSDGNGKWPAASKSSRKAVKRRQQEQQQQQRQQVVESTASDDDWEALVHSMRESHPDNSTTNKPSGTAPAGAAQAAQQHDASTAAGSAAAGGSSSTAAAAVGVHDASNAAASDGEQRLPVLQQLPVSVSLRVCPGSPGDTPAVADSGLCGTAAAGMCLSAAEITPAAPVLLNSTSGPKGSSAASSTRSSKPPGSAILHPAMRASADPLSGCKQAGAALAPRSPRSNSSSRLQSRLGDIYPAAAVVAAAPCGGIGGRGGSKGGSSGGIADKRASVPKAATTTTPLLPVTPSSSSGVLVFGAPAGPSSLRVRTAEAAAAAVSSCPADVTTPLLKQRRKGSTTTGPGAAASPRAAAAGMPLLRTSSSASSTSSGSLQLVSLGGAAPGGISSSSSVVPRSIGSGLRVRQPNKPLGWWVCGGLAVAAVAGGAVAAIYGIMAYFLKVSMVYSLAWKSATGVAAAEGLALGGWSCNKARVQQVEAAKSAAELVRVRKQAAQELTALKVILQQQEAAHSNEVSTLSALNERLTRLTHSLQADNSSLQGALERAAADRKALEAAAALEVKRAETSALVGVTAETTGRVVGEVEQLSRAQQALLALVHELREDLLALVAQQDTAQQPGPSAKGTAAAAAGGAAPAGLSAAAAPAAAATAATMKAATSLTAAGAAVGDAAGAQVQADAAADMFSSFDASGCSSCSSSTVLTGPAGVGSPEAPSCTAVSPAGEQAPSSCGEQEGPSGVVRVSSVRGGVNATLAATVSGILDL